MIKYPPQKYYLSPELLSPHLEVHFSGKRFIENTRYSSVLGISRMDLTPAQTTVTAVRPSSVKSEDTSMAAKLYTQTTSLSASSHINRLNHMKPGLAGLQMLKTSKQGGLHTSINIKTQKECVFVLFHFRWITRTNS
jgi:hypothetical protein